MRTGGLRAGRRLVRATDMGVLDEVSVLELGAGVKRKAQTAAEAGVDDEV